MQPEMVDALPTGDKWQYEVKWDGYRVIAVKRGDDVTVFSRNEKNLTKSYPAASQAVKLLPAQQLVLDARREAQWGTVDGAALHLGAQVGHRAGDREPRMRGGRRSRIRRALLLLS